MSKPTTESTPTAAVDDTALEHIRSGQKFIIYAIFANFIFVGLRTAYPVFAASLVLGATIVAIIGLLRLASGLNYGRGAKVLFVILQFVPLINLIVLIVLNARATIILRKAGYKMGLFGAGSRTIP